MGNRATGLRRGEKLMMFYRKLSAECASEGVVKN